MFWGNLILLILLIISFCFNVAAVWNVSITIKNRSKSLTSLYPGFATFFSFAGVFIWFCFACSQIYLRHTMTFGVWILILTVLTQFLCYLNNKYYVRMFKKAASFREMLDTDELSIDFESTDCLTLT